MSNRYKGGIISATPPTTTGGEDGVASGTWTLEQQMQAQAAGLWPIQPPPLYIENVFSTWLYTGNGATQTITNGINLSGKGGLVWVKNRTNAVVSRVYDTNRGVYQELYTSLTNAQVDRTSVSAGLSSFNADGFSFGNYNYNGTNESGVNYASWTFRKQEKFFDCVTYTGDGTTPRNIAHNLGSAPGCMIVKRTDTTGNWEVYHRSMPSGASRFMELNSTDGETPGTNRWASTNPTSTVFTVGNSAEVNASGGAYVAYLFAHDAGGFGPTESDNVISCGSYVGTGAAGNAITLGYEPQWLLVKNATTGGQNWEMFDNMRGLPTGGASSELFPNTSSAERTAFNIFNVTATGFVTGTSALDETNASGNTYIYIAIRRGPMAVPTDGTKVFSPNVGGATTITTNFPVDLSINTGRNSADRFVMDRLRGSRTNFFNYLETNSTAAETQGTGAGLGFDNNTAFVNSSWSGTNWVWWSFGRAPGFFDEVCYTGTGSNQTLSHNLQAVPELIICKSRTNGSAAYNWSVTFNFGASSYSEMYLNATNAQTNFAYSTVMSAQPTSTTFAVGSNPRTGASSNNYVSYLFASVPGVSKVGTYTGTGATQTIDCGFTGGARFVMIKRADSTADWFVWDTARGMVSGTDPRLILNTTSAEANTNYVYTTTGGFQIVTAINAINASGGTFLFLAIA